MKLYSPHQLKSTIGQTVQSPFFAPIPTSFRPSSTSPLPSACVKTCSKADKRIILITVNGEASKFYEELLKLLAKSCALKSEPQEVGGVEDIQTELLGQLPENSTDKQPCKEGRSGFLKQVDTLIEKNLGNENFKGNDLAKALCCCEMQLYRKLKKITNLSTANYVRRYRLQKSLQMLQHGSYTISDVCYGVGFHSLEYFSRSFKKEFGVCPNEYRSSIMLK